VSREAREAPGTLTALIEEVVRGSRAEPAGPADELRPGMVIGRYALEREVGRGGFGVVWEARDRDLGRTVAFKVLRARGEPAKEKRLFAEAEVAARLSHPNIVTVLDVGRSEHGVFLVQEFLSGAPLSRRLEAGRLPVREAVRIGVELARGLAHAHAHGVVHRDLTPSNVHLLDDGQVKLLDLGMAGALGRRKLEGGTPAYMAPEQAAGEPEDERTDVYALGVLLYRMLTGLAPVAVDERGAPRSASRGLEVPECPPLATLVETMLARRPSERPRDAGVVLQALQELEGTLPRTSAPSRARIRRPPRARWVAAGVAAGLVAAGLVAVPVGMGLARRGPAGGVPAERFALGPSSKQAIGCTWTEVFRTDFDTDKVKLAWRGGDFHGQELRKVDGVPVWYQGADWNQLWVPIGDVRPEVWAVEAQFYAPVDPEYQKGAGITVFADPVGPMHWSTSAAEHGVAVGVLEAPGQPPSVTVHTPSGQIQVSVEHRRTLTAAFTGRWHTLRIEGARAGGWLRATLDGQLLIAEIGVRDLDGRHVALESGGASYHQSNVLWKHLRVQEGTEACR